MPSALRPRRPCSRSATATPLTYGGPAAASCAGAVQRAAAILVRVSRRRSIAYRRACSGGRGRKFSPARRPISAGPSARHGNACRASFMVRRCFLCRRHPEAPAPSARLRASSTRYGAGLEGSNPKYRPLILRGSLRSHLRMTDRLSHTCETVLHCRISAWIRGSSPRMTVQRSRTP